MLSLPYLPEALNVALMIGYWLCVYVFAFHIEKRLKKKPKINYILIYYYLYPSLVLILNTVLLFGEPTKIVYAGFTISLCVLLVTKLMLYAQRSEAKNAIELRLLLRFNQCVDCDIKFKQVNAREKWTMYVALQSIEAAHKNEIVQYLQEYVNPKKYKAVIY